VLDFTSASDLTAWLQGQNNFMDKWVRAISPSAVAILLSKIPWLKCVLGKAEADSQSSELYQMGWNHEPSPTRQSHW
jgi:hypothetical protein